MMTTKIVLRGLLLCLLFSLNLLLACSYETTDPLSRENGDSYWECFSANDCQLGQYCNEFHQCVWPPGAGGGADGGVPDGDMWIPPEVEQEFGAPASGARYVYVALPDLDTVARVDSETLDIVSLPVGDRPEVLSTVAGRDVAVVLNRGSDTVSIIRTVEGVDEITSLPILPDLNRLAVGPLGRFALAYFDLDAPSLQDVGSFQDLSLIALDDGEEVALGVTVGFRPEQVIFDEDESTAYVITEDGVSILDLDTTTEGMVARTVPVNQDPITEGVPTEVVVDPSGRYAFARWDGFTFVRAVDLESGELIDTEIGGVPTDIDLTSSGDRLVAVNRELSQIVVMDIPDDIGDPSAMEVVSCEPLTVGSAVLSPDGGFALVFTNAINQKAILLLDLETLEVQTVLLRKGVRSIAITEDGLSALILHNKLPGEPELTDDFEAQLDKRFGFSVLDVETLFVKLQITDADPGTFAFLPDSSAAYLIVASQSTDLRTVERIDLASFIVTTETLGSHPIGIGAVPGTNRVYVSQEHPMGRLSFIDEATGEMRTVTGFELNSQISE